MQKEIIKSGSTLKTNHEDAWYRRREIMIPLLISSIVGLAIACWFGTGLIAERMWDSYATQQRKKGYAFTEDEFRMQRERETLLLPRQWNSVRLCQYGAKIASLEPHAGLLLGMNREATVHTALLPDPGNCQSIILRLSDGGLAVDESVQIYTMFIGAMTLDKDGSVSAILSEADSRDWDLLYDTRVATLWRHLLCFSDDPSRDQDDIYEKTENLRTDNDTMLLTYACSFLLTGRPDASVSALENMARKYRAPGILSSDEIQRGELNLLILAARSRAFRSDHYNRLLAAPYTTADELRAASKYRFRKWLSEVDALAKQQLTYELPKLGGLWRLIWTDAPIPKAGDAIPLDALSRRTRLLLLRDAVNGYTSYTERLDKLAGTSQWTEPPEHGKVFRTYMPDISVAAIEIYDATRKSLRDIMGSNLKRVVLSFGLYRETHDGKIPGKLEDFVSADRFAELIIVPDTELVYTDNNGQASLCYKYQGKITYPHVYPVILFDPADSPVSFPYTPK